MTLCSAFRFLNATMHCHYCQVGLITLVLVALLQSIALIACRYLIRQGTYGDLPKLAYFWLAAFTPLVHFAACNKVVYLTNRFLYDEELLSLDNYLLGWLFPDG